MASSSRSGLNSSVLHRVWRKLPMELVEVVLKYVPFESLVHFRAVCKRFKFLITSLKFAVECQRQQDRKLVPVIVRSPIPLNSCSMEVFNFDTNSWLTHPLAILEPSLYPLKLSAASGGLFCFVTQGYGRFVVCNPLTGAFRLLELPYPVDICTLVHCQEAFTHLVVDHQMGTFMLVIVTTSGSEADRKTFLYNSINESWRSGAPLPDKDDSITDEVMDTLTLYGDIYFLLDKWQSYKLWKYNVCEDNWNETLINDIICSDESDRVHILEHHGQLVIANVWIYVDWSDHCLGITFYKVIQAVVGQGELVEDTVMGQDLLKNIDPYQRWFDVTSFEDDFTPIGIGDVICITKDRHHPLQVLYVNYSSKKSTLLPVCPMVKSANKAQDIFQLHLLGPSLTIDL